MKKRTVFGLPLTPIHLLEQLKGESFCLSYATRNRLGRQLDDAIRLVADDGILLLDNGAFSAWRSGVPMDVDGFVRWAADICRRCPQAVVVVPDVIDGDELANDEMRLDFSGAMLEADAFIPGERMMMVWHMHESLDRLTGLIEGCYQYIAIGSSGEYAKVGTPQWHARIAEAFDHIERFCADSEGAYVRPWIHMMRAQSEAHRYPFDSADSCSVAVNHCRYKAEGEGHVARYAKRIRGRIDSSCVGIDRLEVEAPAEAARMFDELRHRVKHGTAADSRAAIEASLSRMEQRAIEFETATRGVNINDGDAPYTDMIMAGVKTVETRASRSLDSVVGKRVGIIRTGQGKATLVGYATIGEPYCYPNVDEFRRDYQRHRVQPGSRFDCGGVGKWGYPLTNVERTQERTIERRGNVLRRLD